MKSEPQRDAFKDRLAQKALDTGAAALSHQSLGRVLDANEEALAKALMEIFSGGIQDFDKVAAELAKRGVTAPRSGRKDWTQDLLNQELAQTNTDLDAAYETHGYGA